MLLGGLVPGFFSGLVACFSELVACLCGLAAYIFSGWRAFFSGFVACFSSRWWRVLVG